MITYSVWSLGAGDHCSLTRFPRLTPDALLRRLDSLALSCLSLILGHARALRTRVHLASLSLSSAVSVLSLVSGQRTSRVSWHVSLSLSTCHSSRLSSRSCVVSRLGLRSRSSPLLSLSLLASIAGQPAFITLYDLKVTSQLYYGILIVYSHFR